MQYTQIELEQLVNDVEKIWSTELAKAEEVVKTSQAGESAKVEPLAKAEDEKKEDKKDEAPAEHKEEPKKEEEKPAAEAKPEDKPEHKEDAPAEHKEEAKADDEDACDYDDEDHKHMHSMYMSMKKGELRAHHDAVKKALDAGMEKCGDMSMAKSETVTTIEVKPEDQKPNAEMTLLKSEVEAQKAKAENLQKSLDAVSEFLTKLVKKTAPQAKAITQYEAIQKSESETEATVLDESAIKAILSKKASDPTLKKSDRDAINAFYLNGASINSINHLLK